MAEQYGSNDQSQNPFADLLNHAMREWAKDNLKLSIPGYVTEFDPVKQIATVQIGVKRQQRNGNQYDPNPIPNVPVCFNGSSTHTVEFKVSPGTEGLIEFSHRSIGNWIEQGGIAAPNSLVLFANADATFIPGIRSKAGAIPGFANDGIRIRAVDGSAHVWLKDSGAGEMKAASWEVFGPANFNDAVSHQGVDIGKDHTHPINGGSSAPGPTGGVST